MRMPGRWKLRSLLSGRSQLRSLPRGLLSRLLIVRWTSFSFRENVFALDVLSSDLGLGFEESKRAEEADDESVVADESVKLEDIVDCA